MTTQRWRVTARQYALLACLARTPFLRREDLACQLDITESQLHRSLYPLRERRWLEAITRPAPARAHGPYHLYTLTSAGLRTLRDAPPALCGAQERGYWDLSEGLLCSLLPRLDRFALSQAFLHRLLAQAPRFFAERGTPATVHWSGVRDFRQRVPALPQEGWPAPAQVFADWLVVLRVSLPGSQHEEQQEQLYPLFLLLDHPCLPPQVMAQRLQALMQARQCAARLYPQVVERFPLVLILLPAGQWHRARHWQRHAAELVHDQHLPLRGCLAALAEGPPHVSGAGQEVGQGWYLPWQWLHRYGPCEPIRRLLSAYPREAAPAEWLGPTHHQRVSARPATPSVRYFGGLTSRARHIDPAHLSAKMLGLLGLTLGSTHYRVLEWLLLHPFLSREQVAAFLQMREVSVRQVLTHLEARGCVAAEDLLGEKTPRFRLASHGLRLLALRHHLPLGRIAAPDVEQVTPFPTFHQKGIPALRRHARLTISVTTFFARLAQAATQHPDHRLLWWETGYAREQLYYRLSRPAWRWKQPHGLGEYQAGTRRVRFWLAWHGAEDHLLPKWQHDLAGYASYIASREWTREGQVLPLLLVVCPDGAREKQMQQFASTCWERLHPRPLLLSTTRDLLEAAGPLGPIWQREEQETARENAERPRRCFYDLDRRADPLRSAREEGGKR